MEENRKLSEEEKKLLDFFEEAIRSMTKERIQKLTEMTESIAEYKSLVGKLPA